MREVAVRSVLLFIVFSSIVGPAGGVTLHRSKGDEAALPFKVIVHLGNPASELSRAEISHIFLKQSVSWPNGVSARPVDHVIGSALRDAFSLAIHEKRASAVRNYWQQEIYAGRNVPPPERHNDDEVARYVRENAGAIGYVSQSARLPGVRVLTVVE